MLDKLRYEIDQIDKEIVALFEKRMDVAQKVGAYKKEKGLPVLVPEREKKVIENRLSLVKNPAYKKYTEDLFTSIMELSRRLQSAGGAKNTPRITPKKETPTVAFLGNSGSYSEQAAMNCFPDAASYVSAKDFNALFALLKSGDADYSVVPVENTSTGAIGDVLDLLYAYGYYIIGETVLKIDHVLAAPKGATLSGIKTVYSHPQALSQCAAFLSSMPHVQTVSKNSTSEAALYVKEQNNLENAAIVSRHAATLYGLDVIQEDIQKNDQNTTRFLAISKEMWIEKEADKISLAFTLPHKSGSLLTALSAFSDEGLNLLHIESRPLPGRNFEYLFYTDFAGNLAGEKEKKALSKLETLTSSLSILGNYPLSKEAGI